MMEHDHEQAMLHLDEMRDLTYGYDLPEDACHGLRMLYRELQALEADLHTHLHLENNILFPRAANLEQA
jgi:regulator of cell morphogenesis and NO signaling